MTATHLLSGAGSGIGAELAARLHDRGDDLVLLARTDERAAQLRNTYAGARVLIADLADPAALERLALPDELDSLLHVAGVVDLSPVADSRSASCGSRSTSTWSPRSS